MRIIAAAALCLLGSPYMEPSPAAFGGVAAATRAAAPRTVARSEAPKRHWPALDGLRGVAVLGVILYHARVLSGGFLGVDVFFVLSGFLITSLLISEWDQRGAVSFRDFYARRVLRLFPALGCVIVAALLLLGSLAVIGSPGDRSFARSTLDAVPWVVAFAGNWVRALDPSALIGSLGAFGHTWSLAVEEQFYLVWPAVFVLLMRRRLNRRRLALALALLALAEMVYRVWLARLGYGQYRIYYATDTHSDGLLIGCAAAFWLASRPAGQQVASSAHRAMARLTWVGAGGLAVLFIAAYRQGDPTTTSLAVLASGLLLVGVVTGRTPAALQRLLTSPRVVRVGRRSYGLYLWQYVLLCMTEGLYLRYTSASMAGTLLGRLIFACALMAEVVATFIVAELSYRFVELPALRLKQKFQPISKA
jgi:peptidoglycan/LPS O-acetylase OafA/YrhL